MIPVIIWVAPEKAQGHRNMTYMLKAWKLFFWDWTVCNAKHDTEF